MSLTKKQKELLDYVKQFIDEKGYSPSYREMAVGLGISSVSTVAKHVDNLMVNGYLVKTEGGIRNVEVAGAESKITVDVVDRYAAEHPEETKNIAVLKRALEILGEEGS